MDVAEVAFNILLGVMRWMIQFQQTEEKPKWKGESVKSDGNIAQTASDKKLTHEEMIMEVIKEMKDIFDITINPSDYMQKGKVNDSKVDQSTVPPMPKVKQHDSNSVTDCKKCEHYGSRCYCPPDRECKAFEKKDVKVSHCFQFVTSADWEPGEPGCWMECPFSLMIGLGKSCVYIGGNNPFKCPFKGSARISD